MTRLIVALMSGVAVTFVAECGVLVGVVHPWATFPAAVATVVIVFGLSGILGRKLS